MSALSFARQAFGREKPHSSITDWVDILTSSDIKDEAYDGIPELVDSINLQAAGPTEASRALRKKLKHGTAHQQYRALVILKALVENCGQKFQSTFADGHLTDAFKNIAIDPNADKRVKKKLILVLASWRDQFSSDPSMTLVAGLYKQCRGEGRRMSQQELSDTIGLQLTSEETRRIEKEEMRKKGKQEKAAKAQERQKKRIPFEFEKERPKILASIVDGSQASSNLVNAIRLVNRANESLETNARVQECLTTAKQAKKLVVRYTQLVENEELIGTLIETNDRLMSALEMYDKLIVAGPEAETQDTGAITSGMAAINFDATARSTMDHEHVKKGKDRGPDRPTYVHPDLEDLNFGPLGNLTTNLPPPIRPSTLSDDAAFDQDDRNRRGSLSDFSDYESSDENTHKANAGPSSKRNYVTVSDSDEEAFKNTRVRTQTHENPFADPFADDVAR